MVTVVCASSESCPALPTDPGQDAYVAAVRLLARREHSRRELRRKLLHRGHSGQAVDATLDRVAADGYQSDARFAESFVRVRVARGQGVVKIRAGLRERGIDDGLAASLLDLGDARWRGLAAAALRKRFGDEPVAGRAEWARRARFLAGRGFSAEIARRALDAQGAASDITDAASG